MPSCDAADNAVGVRRSETCHRLLEIAEEAAFSSTQEQNVDSLTAMKAVVRAAGRFGDDDRFDRLLPSLLSADDTSPAVTGAEMAASAGRFAQADAFASDPDPEPEPVWQSAALIAAASVSLRARHLDPGEARPWIRRWLSGALRFELHGELARLLVEFDPSLAPRRCPGFDPVPS
ncbi:hypothetical protein [Streptodolium elevatio]|uniref:Uncharacterized protein n=1 Tax=Streptodolium elevatio TaxID=3157996 RepID=A0ABV3DR69_9ACTN